MGIVSKLFGDDSNRPHKASGPSDYIDLTDYGGHPGAGESSASTLVRVAELRALEDLKSYASYVYDGNMLILDFRAVQGDEVTLRRLTNELRKIAKDTGGDIAGLGEHHILLTPQGVRVDRRKAAPAVETEQKVVPRTMAPPAPPVAASEPSTTFPMPSGPSAGAPPRRTNGARR